MDLFISHPSWTSVICNTPSLRKSPTNQWESRAPWRQRQRRRWIQSSTHGARNILFVNGSGKILGCNFQTPWRVGVEANDAVSASTKVHLSEASNLLRLPEKERPQVWRRLYHPVGDRNDGTRLKHQRYEIVTVPTGSTDVGKKHRKQFVNQHVGQQYQVENVFYVHRKFTYVLVRVMWTASTWLASKNMWDQCGKLFEKPLIWKNRRTAESVYQGCTQGEADVGHHAVQAKQTCSDESPPPK